MKLTKVKLEDVLSRRKWRAFILGTYLTDIKPALVFLYGMYERPFLQLLGQGSNKKLSEVDRAFNIVYRYMMCQPCMERGYCDACGCSTPGNILPEFNNCHAKKWGGMIPDFIKFMQREGIKLNITQNVSKKGIHSLSQEEFDKFFNE